MRKCSNKNHNTIFGSIECFLYRRDKDVLFDLNCCFCVRHWNFTLRFRFGLFWENRKSSAYEKWNDNKIKSVSISWYAESKYCLSPNIWSVHKLIAIYACMRCDHRSVVCVWCMHHKFIRKAEKSMSKSNFLSANL